ncbi:N-glycosylation protein-domain-containing protein [Nemania sp. FL0916]|nr:N-glycosylation protein-domain-containing protein [Nemania sp. FL0916]
MHQPRLSSSSLSPRPTPNGHIPNQGHSHSHSYEGNNNTNAGGHKLATRQPPPVAVSLLQPRVAVLLGLPKRWYRTLSICRLLCLIPCFWWGVRIALRFLVALALQRLNRTGVNIGIKTSIGNGSGDELAPPSLWLTETLLAGLWCLASATLAFYFTDCLMSRWLINYTPQATVVRLLTISCVFAYLTSWIVHVAGGANDPRLLLPAWICIATILTACYHFTQRNVPIRKETFASISVFSIASFVSMLALLLDINAARPLPDPHVVPLVHIARTATGIATRVAVRILGLNWDYTGR